MSFDLCRMNGPHKFEVRKGILREIVSESKDCVSVCRRIEAMKANDGQDITITATCVSESIFQ